MKQVMALAGQEQPVRGDCYQVAADLQSLVSAGRWVTRSMEADVSKPCCTKTFLLFGVGQTLNTHSCQWMCWSA